MKLVTWNIQWCRGCDGRVDPARIVEHARALADFDVLCLQEVASNYPALPGSRGEDQFAQLAALLPGYTALPGIAVDVPGEAGTRRAFGNMILSRLPVQQVLRVALPWPSDPAVRSMPRLLLDATVRAPSGPLRVMTTHLEYYSPAQRAAQVEALRARHAEACAHARHDRVADTSHSPFHGQPHTPSAVLVGDFNFRPEDALHARMLAPFDGTDAPPFVDAWQVLHGERPHAHTNGVHDRVQWPEPYTCDFVFVSGDLRDRIKALRVDAQTQASDHQPVLIELG